MSDHLSVFTSIYEDNKWGNNGSTTYKGSSGFGSSLTFNKEKYIPFIIDFIKGNNIETVVDLGCGDWQSSHLIYQEFDNIKYTGYDAYEKVIINNKTNYPQYNFVHLDIVNNIDQIEKADLCIIKDVLQHWPTQDIYKLLDQITHNKFKYILITNCRTQNYDDQDIVIGEWRQLTANMNPLKKYNPIVLMYYNTKEISLIVNN